nr:hypothetical protein [Tanacetum cinerariifolium]
PHAAERGRGHHRAAQCARALYRHLHPERYQPGQLHQRHYGAAARRRNGCPRQPRAAAAV